MVVCQQLACTEGLAQQPVAQVCRTPTTTTTTGICAMSLNDPHARRCAALTAAASARLFTDEVQTVMFTDVELLEETIEALKVCLAAVCNYCT